MDGRVQVNEQHRINVENAQAEMEDNVHTIQAESLVEAELDVEIRGVQAGEGRKGSSASKSLGCCKDPAFLHNFLAISLRFSKTISERRMECSPRQRQFQGSFSSGRKEMSTMRSERNQRLAKMDHQCQGAATKAFQRALCLVLLCFQGTEQVKATEMSLIRPEKKMKVDPVHLENSTSVEEQFNKEAKQRSRHQTRQGSPKRREAVRTTSTRREEFLLQSTALWEQ